MLVRYIIVCSLLASPALASAVKGYSDSGIKGGQRVLTVERHHEAIKSAQPERQYHQAPTKTLAVPVEQKREQLAATKTAERSHSEAAIKSPIAQYHEQQQQVQREEIQQVAIKREQLPSKTSVERQWEQQAPIKAEQQREEYHQSAIEEQREHREELQQVQQVQQKEEHYSVKGSNYEARPQVRLEESKGGAIRHEETKGRLEESKGGQRLEVQSLTQQREEQQLVAAAPTKSIKSEDSSLKLEQQRLERLERERLERERLEREQLERDRLERERLERERLDLQRLEQQRLEQQKLVEVEQQQQQLEQQREEQQQQSVELNRGDAYEQRRFGEEQIQQIQQTQIVQREETSSSVKGGAAAKGQRQLVAEPEPYSFDYSIEGSTRRESGDTKGVVRGQYTLQGADGSSRVVDYIADHNGFRATVNTNEFGTESRSGAGVEVRSSQPSAEEITQRLSAGGKTSAPAATKSAAAPVEAVPKRPDNWSVKQAPLSLSVPAKGQRLEQVQLQQQKLDSEKQFSSAAQQQTKLETEKELATQQQLAETSIVLEQPTKGELRAPKAIGGDLKRIHQQEEVGQLRAGGFESATAHRNIVSQPQSANLRSAIIRPAAASAPAPVAPVHHRQYLRPARVQYDHQPVVHQLGRGNQEQQSPRLSFYGANSNTEPLAEDSAASFAE